jgi:hypothetical protein
MAHTVHLFLLDAEGRRVAYPIVAASLDLRATLLLVASGGSTRPAEEGAAVRVLAVRVGDAERWVVLADPDADLRVNGIPLSAIGMRTLEHRDEISLAGVGSAFYSEEKLAVVMPFPGADHPVFCGRCHQAVAPGSPVVQCPGCGVIYDQSEILPCYGYAAHCAYCPQPSTLDAGFNWVPAEE